MAAAVLNKPPTPYLPDMRVAAAAPPAATASATASAVVDNLRAGSLAPSGETKAAHAGSPALESLKPRVKHLKVLVLTEKLPDGLGDLVFAVKVCCYLRDRLNLPVSQIGIVTANLTKGDSLIPLLGINEFTQLGREEIAKWEPNLMIVAPVPNMGFVTEQAGDTPCLAIYEYEFFPDTYPQPHIHSYPSGFSEGSIGFWTYPEVIAWAKSPASRNPLARLSHLAKVPLKYQEALLDAPFSPAAVKAFAKNTKLYSGYAREEFDTLYPAMVAIVRADQLAEGDTFALYERNHVFWFMGEKIHFPSYYSGDSESFFNGKFQEFVSIFQKLGIGTFEYICVKLEGESRSECYTLGSGTKTIRIVTGNLPNKYEPARVMSSEFVQVATGNCSFSSILPFFPLFEVLHHSVEVQDAFHARFGDLSSDVNFYTPCSGTLSRKFDLKKLIQFLVKIKTDPVFFDSLQNRLQKIADECNAENGLTKALEQLLDFKATFVPKTVIKLAPLPKVLTGSEIPYDQTIFLPLAEITKLQLTYAGISELAVFGDSIFTYTSVGNGYHVMRKRTET